MKIHPWEANVVDRRILAVLLEGESDRLTFEKAFTLLLRSHTREDALQVFVFRGDVTINDESGEPIDSDDVEENIVSFLRKELRTLGLTHDDLLGIVHIGDLDAVYCKDEQVVFRAARRAFYDAEQGLLFTRDVAATLSRNKNKREALNHLMELPALEFPCHDPALPRQIPHRFFYLGINLEHAFYGNANCGVDEKESRGLRFDEEYVSCLDEWVKFVMSLPCVGKTYEESCRNARKAENAFLPYTNLRFVIPFIASLFPKD